MTHMGKMPIPKSPGFEASLRQIPIAAILPVKQLPTTVSKSQKYGQIAASIREVGLIEPPVVARAAGQDGSFVLLDGHVRLHVLKEMGETSVICLVATDDESFTYNKRISRLATIQEHKMILRAVERGVSEARIAAALNVNIALIRAIYPPQMLGRGVGLNALVVGGLVRLLFEHGGRDPIGRLMLIGLVSAALLALSVKWILRLVRDNGAQEDVA